MIGADLEIAKVGRRGERAQLGKVIQGLHELGIDLVARQAPKKMSLARELGLRVAKRVKSCFLPVAIGKGQDLTVRSNSSANSGLKYRTRSCPYALLA